jgi:C1A family cysteine protease
MKTNGIVSADQYPYTGRQGRCGASSGRDFVVTSVVREKLNGNETRLRDIVATYGPVAVAINAARTLTNYKTGVYTNPKCPKMVNHAVVLVGYGTDSKTKLDYWLVKNSWVS